MMQTARGLSGLTLALMTAMLAGCAADGEGGRAATQPATQPAMAASGIPGGSGTTAPPGAINGQIMLREGRVPDGSVIKVKLYEAEKFDQTNEASNPIAQTTVDDPDHAPIGFELTYDPRRIDPDTAYVVFAATYQDGNRLMLSARQPVITQDHGRIVVLSLGTAATAPQRPSTQPTNAEPKPTGAAEQQAAAPDHAITGEITWASPNPMPKNTTIHLKLMQDEGGEGGPAPVAQKSLTIEQPTPKPIGFTLPFNPRKIRSTRDTTIEVRVVEGGQLRMRNSDPATVLTNGRGRTATVNLEPAGQSD